MGPLSAATLTNVFVGSRNKGNLTILLGRNQGNLTGVKFYSLCMKLYEVKPTTPSPSE